MSRSAVVFSPHYDDETLGAGGTIIQKRRCGARVHLVFMTDGSRSHARAMDSRQLSRLRRSEALEAARALGVSNEDVTCLELPELRLAEHRERALALVQDLLARLQCEQVFLPSTLEPYLWSSDHRVTTDVVFEALRRLGQQPDVFEYLVWFWYHWPWVPLRVGADMRQVLSLTVQRKMGLTTGSGLNLAVPIADVMHEKRVALDQYRSQMTRLVPGKAWPVLGDVGNGDFLERFFQPNEYFKQYRFAAGSR
jgi:LmbE family N-acetylglucosaminyl deacetylase